MIGVIHRRSSKIALSMSSLGSDENHHHADVSTRSTQGLDLRRGSLLVRNGKGGRRREIGMDA